jgi:transposase
VISGESFNSDHFVGNPLTLIHHLPTVGAANKQKIFILQIDNSPIHKSKVVRAKLSEMPAHLAPHPPYSPDLAPLHFFRCGYLKEKMRTLEFDSAEDLLHWIRVEFQRILPAVFWDVFENWINHLKTYVQCEEHSFPENSITAILIRYEITRNGRC